MAISFIRIDDRIIHGQTVTRWANEYPCTGLLVSMMQQQEINF